MLNYREFIDTLQQNKNYLVRFYLPNGERIPKHCHITDVGSVFRHFVDCGGKTKDENYIQIQLWQGADISHQLNAKAVLTILQKSQVVLNKLTKLINSSIFIEYKTNYIF